MAHAHVPAVFRALGIHLITVSTTRAPGADTSGALLRELTETAGHHVAGHARVADDPDAIGAALDAALADPAVAAVVLTGGTGISARDGTPEVVSRRLDRVLPGFGELFRMLSWAEVGAAAMLSSAVGGIAGGRPVFSLPGSTKACRLAMEKLILPELGHLTAELAKETPLPVAASGWEAAVAALGLRVEAAAPLPDDLPAAVVDVLAAGTVGRLTNPDEVWLAVGFPDLLRPSSRVLALRPDRDGWELLALHRFPRRVGLVGTSGWVGEHPLAASSPRSEGTTETTIWACDSTAVYVRTAAGITRWDGHRAIAFGTPAQALASLALQWSQR